MWIGPDKLPSRYPTSGSRASYTLEGFPFDPRMNQQLDQDRIWMQRALELARRGIGVTSPNPAVGCVLLDSAGRLAGEGWHEFDLTDHAEIAAIKAAQNSGLNIRGGTGAVEQIVEQSLVLQCKGRDFMRQCPSRQRLSSNADVARMNSGMMPNPLVTSVQSTRRMKE